MSKSIVKACVRYNDRLYTGFDHGECFKKLNEDNTIIEQGFVDSDGNFVDRKQAMIIARESGQLAYETDKKTLISEDLHLNWLNQQAQRIAELEEQLKNAILLPKYEKGQKIYSISGEKILEGYFQCFNDDVWAEVIVNPKEIIDEDGYTDVDFDVDMFWHKNTFATKEEAQAKLEELKGE